MAKDEPILSSRVILRGPLREVLYDPSPPNAAFPGSVKGDNLLRYFLRQ
jgi:hypothetical protein